MHPIITKTLHTPGPSLPIILDEIQALEAISAFSGLQVVSLDDCVTGSIPSVYLYQKSIEKKQLSIEDIRRWIADITEIPYEAKNLYILRDFDEASSEAMNATLKILEEPPAYAIILLIVKNPESILETIRSRTINCFVGKFHIDLSPLWKEAIIRWNQDDPIPLLSLLYKEKIEHETAKSILLELSHDAKSEMLDKILIALIALHTVNESPRNIIDRVIFGTVSDSFGV